ncbi:MAG: hypothetical protein AB8G17_21435 [Gammaproteobacteria bacterium]
MMRIVLAVITASFLCAPIANATLVELNFGGSFIGDFLDGDEFPAIDFSGQFILDSSVPDSDADDDRGRYLQSVVSGSMIINGTVYSYQGGVGSTFTFDDVSGFDDFFAMDMDLISAEGEDIIFGFQLRDSSRSVFSNGDFPLAWELDNFDPYLFDELGLNSFAGVVFSDVFWQGGFDYATLSVVVPLPPAFGLMLAGLAGLVSVKRVSAAKRR